ncbi:hypothetical protein JTB14_034154 [Gonioctena quinquepunctata]|nr:hypothetical protein JTB14_034154 [Gonioctena quinquepunctata]
MANSPQPSASSNSDSGIGFRDDCGNISDRILVVEFPTQRPLPFMNVNNRPTGIDGSNMPLEGLDMPLNSDQAFSFDNIRQKSLAANPQNNLSKYEEHNDTVTESKYLNNLSNIRACEGVTRSRSETVDSKSDFFVKQNDDSSNRLTCRAMPDSNEPNYSFNIKKSEDNTVVYAERPVDVPDLSPSKKSYECISLNSKSGSVDNISTHSSKSNEFFSLLNIFKVPFESKKPRKQLKMSSLDNLDKYSDNIMNYKLSPKVYGLSKPTYSCEDLNNFDTVEKCGYGSLQDLWSLTDQQIDRNIAQSEPDVRISRNIGSNMVS